MRLKLPRLLHAPLFLMGWVASHAQPATVTVDTTGGKAISPLLMGIFYEDLSYAADGGLYAERIENRSFAYSPSENSEWHPLSFWHLEKRGGGDGILISDSAEPIHPNNPLYLVLGVKEPGAGVGIINYGFGGIPVNQGEPCDFSVFARQLASRESGLTVILETRDGGEVLAKAELPVITTTWEPYKAELIPNKTVDDGRRSIS